MKNKINFNQKFTLSITGEVKGKALNFDSWKVTAPVEFEGIVADINFAYAKSGDIKFGVSNFKKGAPEAKVGDFVDAALKPFIEDQGLSHLLDVKFSVDKVEILVNRKKEFISTTFNNFIEIASFKCESLKKKATYMKVQLGYFDEFMEIVKDFSITDASITASTGKLGKISKGTDSVIKYNLDK